MGVGQFQVLEERAVLIVFRFFSYLLPFPVLPELELLEPLELLEELPLLEALPVALGRLLLLELFTRLLELVLLVRGLALVVVALGRLLLLGRLTLPLFPVRPLLLPLPEGTLGLTLLLDPPLLVADGLLLPWLMLPPLAFGLTVAVGAGVLLLGLGSGLLFHSWVAG